jgi:hypothetical protein
MVSDDPISELRAEPGVAARSDHQELIAVRLGLVRDRADVKSGRQIEAREHRTRVRIERTELALRSASDEHEAAGGNERWAKVQEPSVPFFVLADRRLPANLPAIEVDRMEHSPGGTIAGLSSLAEQITQLAVAKAGAGAPQQPTQGGPRIPKNEAAGLLKVGGGLFSPGALPERLPELLFVELERTSGGGFYFWNRYYAYTGKRPETVLMAARKFRSRKGFDGRVEPWDAA